MSLLDVARIHLASLVNLLLCCETMNHNMKLAPWVNRGKIIVHPDIFTSIRTLQALGMASAVIFEIVDSFRSSVSVHNQVFLNACVLFSVFFIYSVSTASVEKNVLKSKRAGFERKSPRQADMVVRSRC